MTSDLLEFSISQYLDGNLSSEETAALEAQLKIDPAAQALLEAYRQLDSLMKSPPALPVIHWENLSVHLSRAVAEDCEQFEFAVSQFADGTLSPDEAAEVEARLADDPAARTLLSQHQQLNDLLKSPAMLPAIQWEKLAAHLSDFVADASEPQPIKLFSNRWVRGLSSLALAACVLIASALGIRHKMFNHGPAVDQVVIGPLSTGLTSVAITPSTTPILVEIAGPDSETPQGVAMAEISISAGPEASTDESPAFAEGIVARSPRSLMASNAAEVQDGALMPY